MDLVLSCVSYLLVSTSLTIYLFMKKRKEQGENQILVMALSGLFYQCDLIIFIIVIIIIIIFQTVYIIFNICHIFFSTDICLSCLHICQCNQIEMETGTNKI